MIAAETAVLLGESGEFDRAREAADQALAAHRLAPRHEPLSNSLRELACQQAQQQGPEGLRDALAYLADAGRIADEAREAERAAREAERAAGAVEGGVVEGGAGVVEEGALEAGVVEPGTRGPSLDTALAYEYGRVNAYGRAYEDSLAALEKALALLGEPGPEDDWAGEWAECVRLTGAVEGIYLKRTAPALTRVDAAVSHLTALGHEAETAPLTSLAARLRDEG